MYRLTTTYISGQIKSKLYEKYKDAEKELYNKSKNLNIAKMIIHRTTSGKTQKVMLCYK